MNPPQDPKQEPSHADPKATPETPAGEAAAPATPAAEGDLARLEAEREELRQLLIRRQADFDNFRKRMERERREDHDRVVAALAESFLPVLDNFERALAASHEPAYQEYRRGFEMIYRQLTESLAKHGISRMENPVGKRFDPHLHHAIDRVESAEYAPDTVIEESLAGYKFHHRVLRPAQVRVAVHPARHPAESGHKVH